MIKRKFSANLGQLRMEALRGGSPNKDGSLAHGPPVPISEAEIKRIETKIGAGLPDVYRSFLLEIGGALFVQTIVKPVKPREFYGNYYEFSILLGGEADAPDDIWSRLEAYRGRIPESQIAIGENLSGNVFTLCIIGPDRGKIFFHEMVGPDKTLVAHSFEDFLSRLAPAADA